jgi:hypothetical protein
MMSEPKDRTDVAAQAFVAEAFAIAVARVALATMTDAQKAAFRDSVTSSIEEIGAAMVAQAPAIGKSKGMDAKASAAAAGRIANDAKALASALLVDLLGPAH